MENEFKIGVAISEIDKDIFLITKKREEILQKLIMDMQKDIEDRVLKMTSTEALTRIRATINAELEVRDVRTIWHPIYGEMNE